MTVYLDLVLLLNFLVDGLLLLATNRLTGYPPGGGKTMLSAAVGGVYGAACMVPGFSFLGNLFWRLVSLAGMSLLAFGCNASALRRGMIFVLLTMALGGVALGLGEGGIFQLIMAAAGVAALCRLGLRTPCGAQQYCTVELQWQGKNIRLLALRDTGNTLRDPVSGQMVLVLGEQVGKKLGLTERQLRDPVETLASGVLPGSRLIPYRAVGQPGGLLLGLRLEQVKLDGKIVSPLVAFAPGPIGTEDGYQALAGGI